MGRINYVRLIFSHLIFDIVQNLMFFNIFPRLILLTIPYPFWSKFSHFVLDMACGLMIFTKNLKFCYKNFHFISLHFIF